eukprot:gene35205-47311_t
MNVDPATLDTKSIASYTGPGKMTGTVDFILNIIPNTLVDAFAKGEILQVLLIAVLFGFALHRFGGRGTLVFDVIAKGSHVLFGIVNYIMKLAPIGAFGAMAFTIGKYGLGSLFSLGKLMGTFYLTCLLFIFVVLGLIARFHGFSIWKFIKYIKEELLIVLGTSSSESVLPRMMAKLENLGAKKSVVGLVVPTGYSFNLDGTSIYLTMAAVFIAQATNTHMTLVQEITLLAVLLPYPELGPPAGLSGGVGVRARLPDSAGGGAAEFGALGRGDRDTPTVIVMHHPPLDVGIEWMATHADEPWVARFAAAIAGHRQIEAILCGHLHRAIVAPWRGTTVTICPSTAPQVALDLNPIDPE